MRKRLASRRFSKTTQQRAAQSRSLWRWLLLVGGLLGAIVLIYFIWNAQRSPAPVAASQLADPSIGPEAAKVTIIEYGDFG